MKTFLQSKPRFKYFKVAENEFSREELLKIRNIVSTLFLAESHYEGDYKTLEQTYESTEEVHAMLIKSGLQ